jgi:hypothetical protein
MYTILYTLLKKPLFQNKQTLKNNVHIYSTIASIP